MLTSKSRRTRSWDDQGGITLLMIASVLVSVVVTVPLIYLAGAICAQVRLANTADLVALAAANEFLADSPNPCRVATSIAGQNQVHLMECEVKDLAVSVKVGISTANFINLVGMVQLSARAKAGL